jgi:hypothetical protein
VTDRERQIKAAMEALGLTREEAEQYVAIDRAEVPGDVQVDDQGDDSDGGR